MASSEKTSNSHVSAPLSSCPISLLSIRRSTHSSDASLCVTERLPPRALSRRSFGGRWRRAKERNSGCE
eukprot:1166413-Pleurochrysis_carterae.AAC.1